MYHIVDFYRKVNLNTKDGFTNTYVLKSETQKIEVDDMEYLKMKNRGEVKCIKNKLLEGLQ